MKMNMRWLSKGSSSLGLAVGLSLAMASTAYSAPIFEVTPSVLGGPAGSFNAEFILGNAKSLLTVDAANNEISGVGNIQVSGFSGSSGLILPATSGLGVDYELWVNYTYNTRLVSGTLAAPGSVYDIIALSYNLVGSPAVGATFTDPDPATGTAPTVIPVAAVTQIGSGGLIDGAGGAGFNAQGGSFFNSRNSYQNTAFGNTFFTAPVPFFNVSFDEFNNTLQGVNRVGDFIGITSATGGVDFNRAGVSVPEPGSLGLLGLGLLGLCAARKRWSSNSV